MAGDAASPGGGQVATSVQAKECMSCKKSITERFYLKALEQYWHEDCLKCSCCDCRLGEVGSTLFTKANLLLCRRDYLRLFGNTGYCAACKKMIPAFEMVMRAKTNVYHLECFACQQCLHRFCVGDKFYLADNKILCPIDYEERCVYSNMAATNIHNVNINSSSNNNNTNSHLVNTLPTNNHTHNTSNNNNGGITSISNSGSSLHNTPPGIPHSYPGGGVAHIGGMGGGGGGAGGGGGGGMSSMGSYGYVGSGVGVGVGLGVPGAGYNALTQIKRQTQSLSDDVSSGYGSPSPSSL